MKVYTDKFLYGVSLATINSLLYTKRISEKPKWLNILEWGGIEVQTRGVTLVYHYSPTVSYLSLLKL